MASKSIYPHILGSIDVMSEALDMRDSYTRLHCDRVVRLAAELGDACNVIDAELDLLRLCARFHDIGKVGVPDAVLLKPGRLTKEEWALMKEHPVLGERMFAVTGIPQAAQIGKIIRHHHESFDGSGYPDSLVGDQIPLLSRILLIADAYDAMTSSRPYHLARPHNHVMEILEAESGKKLDPLILMKFRIEIEHSPARAP